MNMIRRTFIDHPQSVDETYFEHLRFATGFASRLALAAGAALVHALIPCLCEKTASTIVRELFQKIDGRGG